MAKPKRVQNPCISCRAMGALSKGYAQVKVMGGYEYPICYKCCRTVCGIGKPERDETYEMLSPHGLGPAACIYSPKPITMAIYPGVPNEVEPTVDSE